MPLNPFARSDEGRAIASLHFYGNVPLVHKQSEMTPAQKLFLSEAYIALKESGRDSQKKHGGIDGSLRDKYMQKRIKHRRR
jgi:hypothetical protein